MPGPHMDRSEEARLELEWRADVIKRDRGECVAPRIDPEAGLCYDQWGERLLVKDPAKDLEADYVRMAAVGGRHQFAADHALLCAGHHRGTGPGGGVVWATANRWELREYLDSRREDVGRRAYTGPMNPDAITSMAKELKG